MNGSLSAIDFYRQTPTFRDFSRVADDTWFAALPDDWVVGVADVEQSTKAILENRYKAVNMAGAAVIASVANALKARDFPFVFGGDGAGFAVPAADAARAQLLGRSTWVAEDLQLNLRIGMISVAEIRAQGKDVRVGRYQASDNVCIAMFSGGGLAWADAAMKRGEITYRALIQARIPTCRACPVATILSRHAAARCSHWSSSRAPARSLMIFVRL